MKKIVMIIVACFCLSIIAFGQHEEPTIVLRPHINMIEDEQPVFVLFIKKHHYILEQSKGKDEILEIIDPNWIKTIRVLKTEASLSEAGYSDKNPMISITLKRKCWKKLPKELQEKFEANSE